MDPVEPVDDAHQDDPEEFVDGTPSGDDIPDENDDPNANRSVDVEDNEV